MQNKKNFVLGGAQFSKQYGLNRKTAFSTQAVYKDNVVISVNTLLPNKFIKFLLEKNCSVNDQTMCERPLP